MEHTDGQYPRTLVVMQEPFNNICGAGITVSNLFSGWPKEKLAAIHWASMPIDRRVCEEQYSLTDQELRWRFPLRNVLPAYSKSGFRSGNDGRREEREATHALARSAARAGWRYASRMVGGVEFMVRSDLSHDLAVWLQNFSPEVMYCAPTNYPIIDLVGKIAAFTGVPVIVHIYDDWLSVVGKGGMLQPLYGKITTRAFTRLMRCASNRFVISEEMGTEYRRRYDMPFEAFHNCPDPSPWIEKSRTSYETGDGFVFRFIGEIYHHGNAEVLCELSRALARLRKEGMKVTMEVYTNRKTIGEFSAAFGADAGVTLREVPEDSADVAALCAGADGLVIAYDFDDLSSSRFMLSFPTKFPTCLLSGTPILLYAREDLAVTRRALEHDIAYVIARREPIDGLCARLKTFMSDSRLRRDIACRGRRYAAEHLTADVIRPRFRDAMKLSTSCLMLLMILVVGCFSGSAAARGGTYYISSAGNDANDGMTMAQPWKTIDRVNAASYTSGDSVRFRAGDRFFGQVTVKAEGVTVCAYGEGPKPVITGAVPLTGWTLFHGAIYCASAGTFVKDLYANGVQMTVARYPDSGFIIVGATNGSSWISSPDIVPSSGAWAGGRLHIRTRDWTYETRTIASQRGTTLELSGAPEFSYATGWGFYLDNIYGALDAPGEWYCDPGTNNVFFYAPGGTDPSQMDVQGAVKEYGVSSDRSGTTVAGLSFLFQTAAAVHVYGNASNVKIAWNDIACQWMHGIECVGDHRDVVIDRNTICNVNGRGMNLLQPRSFAITNNTVRNIGLVPGYGSSGFTGLTAIHAQAGERNIISGNTIDSVGYIGIRHDGSYNLIEQNVITNTMLKLADGGAIYAWGGTGGTFGTRIRNNIIRNVPGDVTGVPDQPTVKQGYGIYFDLGCHDMVMENNTIVHAGDAAVFIQYGDHGIVVRGNTFFECAANYYAATLELIQDRTEQRGGHVIANNIFVPLNNAAPLIRIQPPAAFALGEALAQLDNNTYYDPYARRTLFHIVKAVGPCNTYVFSFPEWKRVLHQDAQSKLLGTKFMLPADIAADVKNP